MKKNKLLDIITPAQLADELRSLGSVNKVAKKYHVNPITAYSAVTIAGLEGFVRPNLKNILTKEALEISYDELDSLSAVGRKFNVAGDTVKAYMDKFGLKYKPQVLYACDHEFFSRNNAETFYVAGFMAADGCVTIHQTGNSFQIKVGLARKDEEFLLKIKNLMKAETPIRRYMIENSKINPNWNDTFKSEFEITSKQMFNDLERFNIITRKTHIYTFPKWLTNHQLNHHFMRGYNDGDGSFFIMKPPKENRIAQIAFSLRGTREFLTDYRSILEDKCVLPIRQKPVPMRGPTARLEYGGNGVSTKIYNFLYKDATVFLERKEKIARLALTPTLLRI